MSAGATHQVLFNEPYLTVRGPHWVGAVYENEKASARGMTLKATSREPAESG